MLASTCSVRAKISRSGGAQQGAQVVFEAAAPGLYREQATRDWRAGYEWWRGECQQYLAAYAREFGLWIAVATQAGRTVDEDFPGGAYLYRPDGVCVYETPDWSEGLAFVTVSLSTNPPSAALESRRGALVRSARHRNPHRFTWR